MKSLHLLVAAALFLSAAPSQAQRFLLAQNHPLGARLLDTSAGCLIESAFFDLSVVTPAPLQVTDAQRVGSEVWISARTRLWRFDALRRAHLGAISTGLEPGQLAMTGAGGSVCVAARQSLIELENDGSVLARLPAQDSLDVLASNGERSVSNAFGDSVDHHDLAGDTSDAVRVTFQL